MNENRGSGFFNGFILGLLVGGAVVFLFGTTKGKRVLQMLLEQVEENTELSDLLEMPDEEDDEYFEGLEEDVPAAEEPKGNHKEEATPHKAVAKVKRFFKGAPKKIVS